MDAPYFEHTPNPQRHLPFGAAAASVFPNKSDASTEALGLLRELPLRIRTPLHMPAGSWMWIVSPWPLKAIAQGSGSASQIACTEAVYFSPYTDTWLVPTVALDISFASGWSNLPDELKAQILGHNLTFPEAIDPREETLLALYHHLRISPEIAGLTREAFYQSNTFRLRRHYGGSRRHQRHQHLQRRILLPHPSASALIRRVAIDISISRRADWSQLQKVSQGGHGFTNLRHANVVFDWEETKWSTEEGGTEEMLVEWINKCFGGQIKFKCDGEVAFTGRVWLNYMERASPAVVQKVEEVMRKKLVFQSEPEHAL
jgi:hypothetical protein